MKEGKSDVRSSPSCQFLSDTDFAELQAIAQRYAASQGWFVKLVGKADIVTRYLPTMVKNGIAQVVEPAIRSSSWVAAKTHGGPALLGGKWFHRVGSTISGSVSGIFGIAGAAVDIPVSTTLILRSIQDIAREYGADLSDPAERLEAVTVLGLGGPLSDDDSLDDSFWLIRATIPVATTAAKLNELAGQKFVKEALSSDAFQRVMKSAAVKKIIERFGVVTQAVIAEKAVPVISSVLGGIVNYSFMAHYQEMAHIHYRMRRLERTYDVEDLRACFGRLVRAGKA